MGVLGESAGVGVLGEGGVWVYWVRVGCGCTG